MSLFSSINLANNTLRAQQIGMQVTGQNIANANTPGYIREEVIYKASQTQRVGNLLLGLGVQVDSIVQKTDKFLDSRLRDALSEQGSAEVEEQTYSQLEAIYGELTDTDLSSSLNNFFNTISEILNQPESEAARNLAVLKGKTLADDINRLAIRVGALRKDLNDRVEKGVENVNTLLTKIGDLNIRIANTEGGDLSNSDAVGLRDQRNQALSELAKLIDINVTEQASGSVSVYSSGDFLVLDDNVRQLIAQPKTDRGVTIVEPRIQKTDYAIQFNGGELAGLIKSRDQALGGFLDTLDSFASTLANEFNKVFTSGQGLTGYSNLTSINGVTSATAELDEAGLNAAPVNGTFDVLVYNTQTQETQTTTIRVDLNGLNGDSTLQSVVADLNAVAGINASIDSQGRVVLTANSKDQRIAFAKDSSGFLAAVGLNTFFTGSTARDLSVNKDIIADPTKFAASFNGIGEDTQAAVILASFQERPLASQDGSSLSDLYDRMTTTITQASTIAKSVAEGSRVFSENLSGQSLAISGVNIDEEAIKLLRFQRVFQASARYIQTLDELLSVLVQL
jgi:flagellar hook-associated protein 1 FlgK